MVKRVVFAAVLMALVLFLASGSYADSVGIAVGINGAAPVLVASGSGIATFSTAPGAAAGWTITGTVLGTPPNAEPTLEGLTVDASDTSAGASSVQIYVTEIGLSSPVGLSNLLNGFTSNLILGGIASVNESTFIDNAGTAFALTTPLSSFTFLGPISVAQSQTFGSSVTLVPGFSETEVFNISATGVGTTNDTITISNAPEPGTLTLFGSGLIGLAGLLRRKLALV